MRRCRWRAGRSPSWSWSCTHGKRNTVSPAHPLFACIQAERACWYGRYAQSDEICHHRQSGFVSLERQPQLLHVPPYGHPSVLLVPRREPQPVADMHVALDLVHYARAVLQQGRSALGQGLGETRRVIFEDVEDAVQGVQLGEHCIELCACLAHLADEASQGRGRLRDGVVGRKARRRDGSVRDGQRVLVVPRRRLNQALRFVLELH